MDANLNIERQNSALGPVHFKGNETLYAWNNEICITKVVDTMVTLHIIY